MCQETESGNYASLGRDGVGNSEAPDGVGPNFSNRIFNLPDSGQPFFFLEHLAKTNTRAQQNAL